MDLPPAEDQYGFLLVIVVHLQVFVDTQVLHLSNIGIPIGVGALLACDEGIGPNLEGVTKRGAQAGGVLSSQVIKLRRRGTGWMASGIAATSELILA